MDKTRVAKAKANGVPDSRWIRCAQLDPVVSTNLPPAARAADRSASRIQNFWLDATIRLISLLEKAEDLELPAEAINGIQTSLQLMGNANYQHSMDRRHAIMMQVNPKLKHLICHMDFHDAAPLLFGEKFGSMAKERLEAAEVIKKTTSSDYSKRGFQKGHPQRTSHGGWQPVQRQWRELGMAWSRQQSQERTTKEMTKQHTDCTSMYDNAKNFFHLFR